jgi:hypothetical protein
MQNKWQLHTEWSGSKILQTLLFGNKIMNELLNELEKLYYLAVGAHLATNDEGASEVLRKISIRLEQLIAKKRHKETIV